ncbi:hypothetical protein [Marinisporobacter balticus]|uniref:Uncharacterized protein n=1 Tax=Marinisporobacter balticus TaxID=2018667 RepID=A0A4R2LIH9_9FIRM|nr:hypothetical protein [Marinisporobacter balticus]TCO79135.1 hypothetical protein EV214_103187 [Marinisporobacter balticus]
MGWFSNISKSISKAVSSNSGSSNRSNSSSSKKKKNNSSSSSNGSFSGGLDKIASGLSKLYGGGSSSSGRSSSKNVGIGTAVGTAVGNPALGTALGGLYDAATKTHDSYNKIKKNTSVAPVPPPIDYEALMAKKLAEQQAQYRQQLKQQKKAAQQASASQQGQFDDYKRQQEAAASKQNELMRTLENQLKQRNSQEVYDQIMKMMPKRPDTPTMAYEEAVSRSRNQLGGQIDQGNKRVLSAMDKDAIARGFYGQLPQDMEKRYKAQELEVSKNAAINNLANNMVGQSKEDALNEQKMSMSEQSAQLNTLLSALQQSGAIDQNNINSLMSMMNYYGAKEDSAYNKGRNDRNDMANYTGYYKGAPTMQMRSFQHGLDREKIADQRYSDELAYNRNWNEDNRDYSREQDTWKQGVTEAGLTGQYNGQNTMAKDSLLFNQNMANKNFASQETARKDASARGWANHSLSQQRLALSQAKEAASQRAAKELGVDPKLYNTAYDNVVSYLKSSNMTGLVEAEPEDIDRMAREMISRMKTSDEEKLLQERAIAEKNMQDGLNSIGTIPMLNAMR